MDNQGTEHINAHILGHEHNSNNDAIQHSLFLISLLLCFSLFSFSFSLFVFFLPLTSSGCVLFLTFLNKWINHVNGACAAAQKTIRTHTHTSTHAHQLWRTPIAVCGVEPTTVRLGSECSANRTEEAYSTCVHIRYPFSEHFDFAAGRGHALRNWSLLETRAA